MGDTASETNPLTCPFCEAAPLGDFGRNSARCAACGGILGGEFLRMLRGIAALPGAPGLHACECDHPEMRLLPDGVYRCPACGAEVLPPSAATVSWKAPGQTEAYCQGWLDGRFGERELFPQSQRLARWDTAPERLDYYRGHRAGHEARTGENWLIEAS